ncbi:MAG: twin-arginine translocation signal domain-containing protein [Hydrogenovibrio crunogenus]|uniref:Twin-arginine translocation signal domain-containing protein n=1 Tax=Hydrogenovibrio crunogenus (strain DSM 25203 / XCL-2) TaxID=317025 RepID=Q31EQ5_HYDCU|nr:twin-arginine translocation signal domain-containing protein [Hydrogenovibrio sp. 3SP14C1]MBD3612929.1 twin-arginine translocation signal domain-containing protein [Hydrogenovibrio crunogenus]MDG4812344.1 twin-arginine translocation signal domain-containing protein [Hydrogenovibrio sp. 3SP14C1]
MSKQSRRDFLKLASATTAATLTGSALASENPFGFKKLDGGYQQVAVEGKCGEGKCGEGKCGGDMRKNIPQEGKCGEGKCGAGMDMTPDKTQEGKCGEGKCGAGMDMTPDKTEEGKCGGRS